MRKCVRHQSPVRAHSKTAKNNVFSLHKYSNPNRESADFRNLGGKGKSRRDILSVLLL